MDSIEPKAINEPPAAAVAAAAAAACSELGPLEAPGVASQNPKP